MDSDWEAEFCRVAESHPRVRAYVKNHNLGLEVPYRYGSETRKYVPDFIVLVEDGHGEQDLLRLIVEIKGYRREDAKDKKSTMEILGEIKIKAGVPLDIECMRELQEQLPGAGVTGGGAFPEGGPLEIKRGLDVVHISLDRNAAATVTVSFKWLERSRVEEERGALHSSMT